MKYLSLILIVLFISCKSKYDIYCSHVCDGDSFYSGDKEYRLNNCDAPENTRGHNQLFGHEATQFARKYLEGKTVTIYRQCKDKYGRYVVDVYLEDGTYFNKMIVDSGLARVYLKYDKKHLFKYEEKAKENKIGLWAYPSISPYQFRKLEHKY